MTDAIPVRRALISVSDKTGLVAFAQKLTAYGAQIISTGGTAKALTQAGVSVTPVERLTDWPEMMDGRVKTLHPRIHGGLLALRDHADHLAAMRQHRIEPIDLVCVNLYPFEKTVAKSGVTDAEAIEQIDIGGPSMIRSAAKNHRFVAVVTDPSQYDSVCQALETHQGATDGSLRFKLAAEAFARTAAYDAAIAAWFSQRNTRSEETGSVSVPFPDPLVLRLKRLAVLRYGENPHQAAAVYAQEPVGEASVAHARQLHGKELSYNNLNDAAAALELVKEFTQPAAAVIKHANPCGCAVGDSLAEAFEGAYAGDPLAAFGGVVALNRKVDRPTADLLTRPGPDGVTKFLEVILAPDYDQDALEVLRARWKNVRLLAVGSMPGPHDRRAEVLDYRSIVGGALVQERDLADMSPSGWRHVAGPPPAKEWERSLHTAWCTVKHAKSNAIVIARDGTVVGVGAGQMDRVGACGIAVAKANAGGVNRAQGAVAASDAFFPFRDGPDVLIAAGVKAIVQPGGSKQDDQTIAACNEGRVTLLFTGRRHFRH